MPEDTITIDSNSSTDPWWVILRCAADETPRHPTLEYAIVRAPSSQRAAGRLAQALGGALSCHVQPGSFATHSEAIEAVRGAQAAEEFVARPDVAVMDEEA